MGRKGGHRHGRVTTGGKAAARFNWDPRPGRDDELRSAVSEQLTDPTPRRAPAHRKDTRRWCHGREGVQHVGTIVPRPRYGRVCQYAKRWSRRKREWDGVYWSCQHREECINCGRVIRDRGQLEPTECPDYHKYGELLCPG